MPSELVQAKSVVFELDCPKAFLDYREATWALIGSLGGPGLLPSQAQAYSLFDPKYSALSSYRGPGSRNEYRICLASTKKPHLGTHYTDRSFPVSENDLFRENGMTFSYFDNELEVWPSRLIFKPSFAHHCELILPRKSLLFSISHSMKLSINSNPPSSYEVLANQTHCPAGLNTQEFMAYMSLFLGKEQHWTHILHELRSSNLNFSSESTALLISSLALQVRPWSLNGEHFGAVHASLLDEKFCTKLIDQLHSRLDGISSNWRETICMETIITLLVQLEQFGNVNRQHALELFQRVRKITLFWMAALRQEAENAKDAETSNRCSKYALWAALLCRRTFVLHVDNPKALELQDLRIFLECSVALQDNLFSDTEKLKGTLRRAVIRDAKMASRLRHSLRRTVEEHPNDLLEFISAIWPNIQDDAMVSPPKLLTGSNDCWVEITVESSAIKSKQIIHVHLLEGHFLVMGQPIGRLSAIYRESVTIQALFGSQSLLTYPSHLPGMSYVLKLDHNKHQIHLGLRDGKVLVRALIHGELHELIPPESFYGRENFDFPFSLITECVHWLNLTTGVLDIRRQPNIWSSRNLSNWKLNVWTKQAQRGKKGTTLVNPQSVIFHAVRDIFHGFERPEHITVYQPACGPLSVELRRLGLSFKVTNGWLRSPQLQAEINGNRKLLHLPHFSICLL